MREFCRTFIAGALREPALRICLRIDQIGKRLDPVEIELVVNQRTMCESPGRASRKPSNDERARRTAAMVASDPWIWISAQFSPVKLAGAGNQNTSPSSRRSPVRGSRSLANVARRGLS